MSKTTRINPPNGSATILFMSTSCYVLSASSPVLAQISRETELKEVQNGENDGDGPL